MAAQICSLEHVDEKPDFANTTAKGVAQPKDLQQVFHMNRGPSQLAVPAIRTENVHTNLAFHGGARPCRSPAQLDTPKVIAIVALPGLPVYVLISN